MKLLFIIPLFFFASLKGQTDKTLHVYAGMGISVLASQLTFHVITDERWCVSLFAGGVAGWSAGVVKENIWDASGRGVKDRMDLYATGYGTFVGMIGSTVSFDIHRKRKHKDAYYEEYEF